MPTINYDFESDTIGQQPANTTHQHSGTALVQAGQVCEFSAAVENDLLLDLVPDSISLDVDFTASAPASGGQRPGVTLFCDAGVQNGYCVQIDNLSDNRVEIYRRQSGYSLLASAALPTATRWRATATVSGAVTTITVYYWDGSAWIQVVQVNDSAFVSGRVSLSSISGTAASQYDDVAVTYETSAPSEIITLTSPVGAQGIQQVGGSAMMAVAGTYTGSPSAIEYQVGTGQWLVGDPTPGGGSFSFPVVVPIGQHVIRVRFANNTSISDSAADVTVGDVFLLGGDSIAEGRGTNLQLHGSSLKPVTWKGSWAIADDPVDSGTSVGSHWPHFGRLYSEATGIPAIFIACGQGSTDVINENNQWEKPNSAYNAAIAAITASGVTGITAALFHLGPNATVVATAFVASEYQAALETLHANLESDINAMPLFLSLFGQVATGNPTLITEARQGIQDAIAANADIYIGPDLSADTYADGVHPQSDAELLDVGTKWADAVLAVLSPPSPKSVTITLRNGLTASDVKIVEA